MNLGPAAFIGGFRSLRPGRMAVDSVLVLALSLGIFTTSGLASFIESNSNSICELVTCVQWCECTSQPIDFSEFHRVFLCPFFPNYSVHGTCRADNATAFLTQATNSERDSCQPSSENDYIFFRNETEGEGYALRVWYSEEPDNHLLVKDLCASQCRAECGLTVAPTRAPTTTPMLTRKIDEMIPRFSESPLQTTAAAETAGLSSADARLIGIAVGAFLVGLIICLVVVCIFYQRRRRRRRGPKLPPRRHLNDNRDYATIEEMNHMRNSRGPGGQFPNALYRGESVTELSSFNANATMTRSTSDLDMLGDPPYPPVRQPSSLPGVNPSITDSADGRSAPIDDNGYTRYLPENEEAPSLPYMHLKVTPTLSAPASDNRVTRKPHRYRSHTASSDTHHDAADVERAIERIRTREAVRDSSNRRFVPNQSGRGRSSTVSEEYNRLTRHGHRPVPRSKKIDGGAFTAAPVYGQYQSKARMSPENVRKWRSLPDLSDGCQAGAEIMKAHPVYHVLDSGSASSIDDYTKRQTRDVQSVGRDEIDPKPVQSSSLNVGNGKARRAVSESSPATHRPTGQSDTMAHKYDTVYEPRQTNKETSSSPGVYQPLAPRRNQDDDDFDDEAYQGSDEWLDSDSYLKPKITSPGKANGDINGGIGATHSPSAQLPNGLHVEDDSSKNQSYIYESDNNNLSLKKTPPKNVGGSIYSPLRLTETDSVCDIDEDDDMENGEYMYQPAGPGIDIMA